MKNIHNTCLKMSIDNIVSIKHELYLAKCQVRNLEEKLRKEQEELQKICEHDFIAEENGDYHKFGYYYTCRRCDYFTHIRPKPKS